MKPFLSIVTITYKDPDGLNATAESLRALYESDLRWEHVVVDGSLKENAAVIRALPEDWPLRHIPSPPKGIYAAINAGVDSARGDIVQLLHGGDRIKDTNSLLRLAREMDDDHGIDVYCAGAALHRRGKFTYVHPAPSSWRRGLVGINRFCHQAMLYRRARLIKIGAFSGDFPLASDYEHHFRCFLHGYSLKSDSDVLVDFDTGGASGNVRQALAEFRAVQLSLARELPLYLNLANALVWWFEEKRIRLFKAVGKSVAGEALKQAWHAWKRRR